DGSRSFRRPAAMQRRSAGQGRTLKFCVSFSECVLVVSVIEGPRQMDDINDWLKLAPQPAPLEPGRKWHVFLSYRSSERAWVLSLYDILRQLDYSVFMDQFVLPSGAPLARSLGKNLEASQAGILIWSPRSEESQWCQDEYDSFVTLRNER